MKKVTFLLVIAASTPITVFAQDPNCMWGQDDILCQSSRMQQQYQQNSRGNRSGGINDERIYVPEAGSYAEDMVEQSRQQFEKGFDDRYANPYSLQYDPTRDRCMMDPSCDMAAKRIAHYDWLGRACENGDNVACRKLQDGAYTPAPSFSYPNGERMNVPYPPGYEPYRER
jgi:hypothetical protein